MKYASKKSLASFVMVSAIALMIGACSNNQSQTEPPQAEPQIVVVTATPTTSTVSKNMLEAPAPVIQEKIEPEVPNPQPIVDTYEAGTLLKGSGDGIFYLTETGTRQHIYDWETFLAFGFEAEDIVEVDNEALESVPLQGQLTRLVAADDTFAWVINGQRFRVRIPDLGQSTSAQIRHFGVPVSPLDDTLVKQLPLRSFFKPGSLLRADDTAYYYDRQKIVPILADLGDETEVIEVPTGLLAGYTVKTTGLDRYLTRLDTTILAANVRSGPGLDYEVLGVISGESKFEINGRVESGNWLSVPYRGQTGWLAADLVEPSIALGLLVVKQDVIETVAELPQAEPAAMTETSEAEVAETSETLQPIYCTDVPIRGFGQVWGEHLEVQNTLGCPNSWRGGEHSTKAAVQSFQNGLMLWLESDSVYSGDPVYVFFNDGSYQRFGDLGAADPEKVDTVPTEFYDVGDKFSKVYWEGTGARVKERLGFATTEATDSAGAFQEFYNGRMFWAETIDEIFVIYNYSYYDEATEQSIWVRSWERYKDTF